MRCGAAAIVATLARTNSEALAGKQGVPGALKHLEGGLEMCKAYLTAPDQATRAAHAECLGELAAFVSVLAEPWIEAALNCLRAPLEAAVAWSIGGPSSGAPATLAAQSSQELNYLEGGIGWSAPGDLRDLWPEVAGAWQALARAGRRRDSDVGEEMANLTLAILQSFDDAVHSASEWGRVGGGGAVGDGRTRQRDRCTRGCR